MKKHIRCGRLFTGSGGEARKDQTIVIEDGLIVFVGPTAEVSPARGVEVVDCGDHFVLPGLIDFHTHLSYGNAKCEEDVDIYAPAEFRAIRAMFFAQKVLAAGFTSICDPGTNGRIALSVRDAIEARLFEGPRITAAGPYLTSRNSVTDWYPTWIEHPATANGTLVRSKDEAIETIRCQVKDGVDAVKIAMDGRLFPREQSDPRSDGPIATFTEDECRAMVVEAKRLGRMTIVHARGREGALYSARSGVDVIMHASFADGEVLEAILENGCALCPTLTLLVNFVEFSQPADRSHEWVDAAKYEVERAAEFLIQAHKAGVPILSGTDSGFAMTPYGEWHAKELDIFVRLLGMSAVDALRTATSHPARYLNDGVRLGVVSAGRHADLLVIDGDPLADVSVLQDRSRFKAIFKGGEEVSMATRTYNPRKVSDFSLAISSDLYTQVRVAELKDQVRPMAAR